MTELMQLGQRVLAAQAFSVLIGAELTAFGDGHAEIRIPIVDRLKQQNGFVHGGVLSYAADNTLTFAGGSVLGAQVVTSEFKINYLRPALGEQLVARATVVHAGKSQAVCSCDIFAIDAQGERLCATAQETISRLGPGPTEEH